MNCYFSARYARIARRRGPNNAAVAVANSLDKVLWPVCSTGTFSEDLRADSFERRDDPTRQAARLQRRFETLGYSVTSAEKPA